MLREVKERDPGKVAANYHAPERAEVDVRRLDLTEVERHTANECREEKPLYMYHPPGAPQPHEGWWGVELW